MKDTRYEIGASALLEFLLLESLSQRLNPKVLAKFLKLERTRGLELNFHRCAWKQIKGYNLLCLRVRCHHTRYSSPRPSATAKLWLPRRVDTSGS